MEALTIGALAKAAAVHVETVRYYHRRGLLREPARPPQRNSPLCRRRRFAIALHQARTAERLHIG
ncbi:MAG: MerR family DNA-binding transcriptional regulator [Steroidobacteraceae bacterium]